MQLSFHGQRTKDKLFNATLKTDFDPAIGKVLLVPQDFGRLLLNVFNNAFYAVNEKKKKMGEDYHPTVSASSKAISADEENTGIEIRIKDNGFGISNKNLDKIFQPFFTTKPAGKGTGLGLSLSYDVVTKGHGGQIKIETKEGEFAEFIIFIPS
jgi:signal transduction histidine kinase